MNIHEYQAKQLLSQYNIPVLDGFVAFNQEELGKNISSLNGPKWVVKAQIHAGGRGKGGGVKVVDTKCCKLSTCLRKSASRHGRAF